MSKNIQNEKISSLSDLSFATQDIKPLQLRFDYWGCFMVERWKYQKVMQKTWILYWNPTPGMIIQHDGKIIEVGPDNVLIIPPFTEYSGYTKHPFLHFYAHFHVVSPEWVTKHEIIQLDASFMVEPVFKMKNSSQETRNVLLYSIVTKALSMIPKKYFLAHDKEFDERIMKVLTMLNKNPQKNFTIEELLEYAKMSRKHFYNSFFAVTGSTPKDYIQDNRLRYARNLLMETDKPIDEIAEITGYTNRYHFSKVFKKIYAHSPVAYKKRLIRLGYMYDARNQTQIGFKNDDFQMHVDQNKSSPGKE